MGTFRERLRNVINEKEQSDIQYQETPKRVEMERLQKEEDKRIFRENKLKLLGQKTVELFTPILSDINKEVAGNRGKIQLNLSNHDYFSDEGFLEKSFDELDLIWDSVERGNKKITGDWSLEWKQISIRLSFNGTVDVPESSNSKIEHHININNEGWEEKLHERILTFIASFGIYTRHMDNNPDYNVSGNEGGYM